MLVEKYDSRERVLRTIGHEPADRMPKGELCISDAVVRKELNCGTVGFEERYEFVRSLGLDIFTVLPEIDNPDKDLPFIDEIKWPDIEMWTDKTPLFTFAVVDGAFEIGMRTHSDLQFLTMPYRSPLAFKEFIDRVESLNISIFKELSQKGVDGVILADDVAYRDGLLTGPGTLREHFLPSLARQVKELDRLGLTAFYHCDGNYLEIVPDLIDAGFKGIQCLERSCGMDIFELQAQFGSRLCLWGHLGVDDIAKAKDSNWLNNIAGQIKKLSAQSGVILGTSSGLFEGMDIKGLKTIYELA